jgi:CRP-like cAMP-binding protein
VTDFLQQKRAEITKRLDELRPLLDEYERLEAAAAALDQVGASNATARSTGARRGPGRPRGSRNATTRAAGAAATGKARATRGRRPGRQRGTGTRALQTLALVQQAPQGITIPELAAQMGIRQNYLYRVLPSLQKEGKVRKRGKTWLATATSA